MLGKNNKLNVNDTTFKILALYRSDYRRALHTREIARSVATDVQPVSVQLRRLEEASILKSTVKGKHKEYRLNLENILTKYYLVLAETYTTLSFLDRNFLVKRVLEELDETDTTALFSTLVLFGSFASERANERSDIDILTITDFDEQIAFLRAESSSVDAQTSHVKVAGKDSLKNIVRNIEIEIGREINIKQTTPLQFMNGLRAASPFEREVVTHHVVLRNIDSFCGIMWEFFRTWR